MGLRAYPLVAIGLAFGLLAFCPDPPASAQSTPTREAPPQALVVSNAPIHAGQSDSVGFQTVWREILTEANINFRFTDAPRARKRRLFVQGRIKLDCCAAPIWRTRPEEIETQRWSETFYVTREQFLFRKDEAFPVASNEDLKKLRVATVRGFEYRDSSHFGVNVAGRDLPDTFRLLHARRADVGIISNVDFYALAHQFPGAYMLGPVRVRAPQKIRAHKDVAHLLPQINEAIRRLNDKGRIIAILEGSNAKN